ncbi:MAG: hypothetical protein KDD62_12280, partial [Bdellovibrionales bacterium]|nr:hypothetical protein [Bdellovibrionales bacterium]
LEKDSSAAPIDADDLDAIRRFEHLRIHARTPWTQLVESALSDDMRTAHEPHKRALLVLDHAIRGMTEYQEQARALKLAELTPCLQRMNEFLSNIDDFDDEQWATLEIDLTTPILSALFVDNLGRLSSDDPELQRLVPADFALIGVLDMPIIPPPIHATHPLYREIENSYDTRIQLLQSAGLKLEEFLKMMGGLEAAPNQPYSASSLQAVLGIETRGDAVYVRAIGYIKDIENISGEHNGF